MKGLKISKASLGDAEAIRGLIEVYAEENKMLRRSLSEIYTVIREFHIAKKDGEVVGCAALHVYSREMAEIRSLAVEQSLTLKGVGSALVEEVLKEAKQLGVKKVFTLTMVPEFFEKMSFYLVDRDTLPMKIWADCIKCPKFMECDEHPYVKEI